MTTYSNSEDYASDKDAIMRQARATQKRREIEEAKAEVARLEAEEHQEISTNQQGELTLDMTGESERVEMPKKLVLDFTPGHQYTNEDGSIATTEEELAAIQAKKAPSIKKAKVNDRVKEDAWTNAKDMMTNTNLSIQEYVTQDGDIFHYIPKSLLSFADARATMALYDKIMKVNFENEYHVDARTGEPKDVDIVENANIISDAVASYTILRALTPTGQKRFTKADKDKMFGSAKEAQKYDDFVDHLLGEDFDTEKVMEELLGIAELEKKSETTQTSDTISG